MRRLLLFVASAAALSLAACGGGGGLPPLPPPTGNYGNASLNGTYAFVTSGQVATGFNTGFPTQTPFVRTGSFTADGQGHITGGVEDLAFSGAGAGGAGTTISPANFIANTSSYSVNPDGRGVLNLVVTSNGFASTVTLGIVLTSTSDGLMIDETSLIGQNTTQASTASGNFIKQDPNSFTVPVSGTYVFDFSGLDLNGFPASIVGEIAASGGAISTGFEDSNDNGSLNSAPIGGGGGFGSDATNPSTLASNGRGVATFAGETYVYYIVNVNRIRLIDMGGSNMLTGDLALQANSAPTTLASLSSGYAFILSGTSLSFTNSGGLTRVGRFTSSSGNLSQAYVDTNNAGQLILTNISGSAGSFSQDPVNPEIPGRWLLTLTDPSNNSQFTAVVYFSSASTAVIQETTQTNFGAVSVADGSLAAQSGSPSSSSVTGPYAFNWSGVSAQQGSPTANQEEDCAGQVTSTNLSLTGASDLYEFGLYAAIPDLKTTGSISIGGNGTTSDGNRSKLTLNIAQFSGTATVGFVVYFVNPQTAFFASNLNPAGRVAAGIIEAQQ